MNKKYARLIDPDGNLIQLYNGDILHLHDGTYTLLDPPPDNIQLFGNGDSTHLITTLTDPKIKLNIPITRPKEAPKK